MQDSAHPWRSKWINRICQNWKPISILIAYVLLSIAMTWPLAARLGTHIPSGSGNDVWTHQWAFWWVKKALTEGRNPFYTDLIFHPHGVSLAFHNVAWLNIAAWIPLQAIVGSHAAYSLTFIAAFALNGFAMYLLCREWIGSRLAAFIGGLIYGFWPFTLSQSGHPNMNVVCWVPLALLYLRRMLKAGRKRDAVLAAVFLALTGLVRWQLLIMSGVAIGLYLLYECLTDKTCRSWRTLGLLTLVGLVTAVLIAPLAVPVAIAQLTRAHPDDIFIDEQAFGQTDLLAYALPNRNLTFWGGVAARFPESIGLGTDRVDFVGYTTVVLALYGTARKWRLARFWALVALVYVALALGPQLRIGGQFFPQVPMPYRLVSDLFFIRILRKPFRFNVFLGLPMGMLAALGVATLLRKRSMGRTPFLLAGALGTLILLEYCIVPYRLTRPQTPTWFYHLAQETERFAVLDLPIQLGFSNKQYMFYQITHGKPLVEGRIARVPREAFAFLDSTPFLSRLRHDNVMDARVTDVSHQLLTLAHADVRYIILHKRFAPPEQLAAWQDWLTFQPLHEDADLIVYRTQPSLGQDFSLVHPLTDQLGLIRASFAPLETAQTGSVLVDARWGAVAPPAQDYDVCLTLVDAQGDPAQSACQPLSPSWPPSRWQANEVVRDTYPLQIDPFLDPGAYTLTLSLTDSASGLEASDDVTLGPLQVKPLPRVFDTPSPSHPLHARWADDLLLLGFDLHLSDDTLTLTLFWQALQRMDASYKVFVHLVDPASGRILAQDDAVPRRWMYHTHWWEQGEVVEDAIPLSLADVPAGHYTLFVGVYDPQTGGRLPAFSADGQRLPDDAAPLTDMQR